MSSTLARYTSLQSVKALQIFEKLRIKLFVEIHIAPSLVIAFQLLERHSSLLNVDFWNNSTDSKSSNLWTAATVWTAAAQSIQCS